MRTAPVPVAAYFGVSAVCPDVCRRGSDRLYSPDSIRRAGIESAPFQRLLDFANLAVLGLAGSVRCWRPQPLRIFRARAARAYDVVLSLPDQRMFISGGGLSAVRPNVVGCDLAVFVPQFPSDGPGSNPHWRSTC